ncbi:MAG: uracil phosphoribosyltransferase [Deltaproteobacteria bacterium]|nr:uracil phosphoribosyltransferase [Deltaproteobacteria bacterium]
MVHLYGPNVHIADSPSLFHLLARFSSPDTRQPDINALVRYLYAELARMVLDGEFPAARVETKTRMHSLTPAGVVRGTGLDTSVRAVICCIMRAGVIPSLAFFDFLSWCLGPDAVRQDFISSSRSTDERGCVTGAIVESSKIGGSIEGSILVFPDPMGATGSTLSSVLKEYGARKLGRPKKVIAANLMVTPEYLRHVTRAHPEMRVYALRLDRGLSEASVLATVPGTHWDRERGLNDHQYIVPGAGGVGEIINNSFV